MSDIVRPVKMEKEYYEQLKRIHRKSGKAIASLVKEAMKLVIEGKLKIVKTETGKGQKKTLWLRISDKELYDKFTEICNTLGYDSFSPCIRDALISLMSSNIRFDEKKEKKAILKTVAINRNDSKKLSIICDKLGYSTESKCIKMALNLFLDSEVEVTKDGRLEFPFKVMKVRLSADEYSKVYEKCEKLGYKNFSECARFAIKLWLESQEMVKVNER